MGLGREDYIYANVDCIDISGETIYDHQEDCEYYPERGEDWAFLEELYYERLSIYYKSLRQQMTDILPADGWSVCSAYEANNLIYLFMRDSDYYVSTYDHWLTGYTFEKTGDKSDPISDFPELRPHADIEIYTQEEVDESGREECTFFPPTDGTPNPYSIYIDYLRTNSHDRLLKLYNNLADRQYFACQTESIYPNTKVLRVSEDVTPSEEYLDSVYSLRSILRVNGHDVSDKDILISIGDNDFEELYDTVANVRVLVYEAFGDSLEEYCTPIPVDENFVTSINGLMDEKIEKYLGIVTGWTYVIIQFYYSVSKVRLRTKLKEYDND